MAVSLLAVVINCYPIVFCGRSYVSPASAGEALVYNWWPNSPGMAPWPDPSTRNSVHGSDVEAMMWWGIPAGFIESRSLLEQGELPLWDRYGHAGEPFIGQALTMLGDPLQLIVIFGHGSAWAWDLKYLAAKFLFCLGFGWLIWRLMESHSLGLIFAALAAYCGAYFYIYSHPVFFVLAHAPWILLAAIEWLDPRSKHPVRWGLAWLLANIACFTAGHVEVAVVLIGGLNLAALASALIGAREVHACARILARLGTGTLFFLGLTAPLWMSFLTALTGAYTSHSVIRVVQFSPRILAGAFDDLFYQLLRSNDGVSALAPGSSLLILTGCCLSLLRWRQLKTAPFFWVNSLAILWWASCIFGWVPNFLLAMIPLLNRVGHNGTDFSYLLIIHLTIGSAYGFRCLNRPVPVWRAVCELAFVWVVFFGLTGLYLSKFWHQPVPWTYFWCAMVGATGAPLLFVLSKDQRGMARGLGWAGILVLGFVPNVRFGLYNFGNDALFMRPGPRVALNAPDKAIDQIKSDTAEPFRVTGLHSCLMGDYAAVYGLEDIRSCAPLSNPAYMDLVRNFPGMELTNEWMIMIQEPVPAQPLLNLLNVKYLLTLPEVKLPAGLDFRLVNRDSFGVVENLEAWPRAFFDNQIVSLPTTGEFIKYLGTHARQPFIALTSEEIERQPGIKNLETGGQGVVSPATHYQLLPNTTEFDIQAPSAGVVCLTEGQAKDFTVTANGEPKAVLTVNRAFKGVYLDKPGTYHVKFIYRPRRWQLAGGIFWLTMAGMITMILMRMRLMKRQAPAESGLVPGQMSSV